MNGVGRTGWFMGLWVMLLTTGCLTMRSPSRLAVEVRQRIDTVVVHPQVDVPHKIDTPDFGSGVAGTVASSRRESGFNRKVSSHTDVQKMIGETVRSTFKHRVATGNVFELVEDGKEADGEFLLEVRYLGMTKPRFSATSRLTPSIRVDVTLIENAPASLMRSRSGRLVPVDRHRNPVVYHRSYKVRNTPAIPSYKQSEFETDKEKFQTAFTAAIEDAIRTIVSEW